MRTLKSKIPMYNSVDGPWGSRGSALNKQFIRLKEYHLNEVLQKLPESPLTVSAIYGIIEEHKQH